MQAAYHIDITHQALRSCFSAPALAVIRAANLGQDSLRGQIGHPEYHFDDNNFQQGLAYIRYQRQLIHKALEAWLQEQARQQRAKPGGLLAGWYMGRRIFTPTAIMCSFGLTARLPTALPPDRRTSNRWIWS